MPNSTASVLKYGGNTTCFEISTYNYQIFYDAGSGFCSADLFRDSKDVFIFFSHFHHDHIQGLLFNSSLFYQGKKVILTSALYNKKNIFTILRGYFSEPYFPVDIFNTLKSLSVENFNTVVKKLKNEISVSYIKLNHPGGAVGYKFTENKKTIVILLDNEFNKEQETRLIDFCNNANLVVWDATFTENELQKNEGFGHSSIEQAENFTLRANIEKMVLCHHAPGRTDAEIDSLSKSISSSKVFFGYEKMNITL
ncbi:MBL fold metallo-hydrolase [Alphaproteobacteria bacterium]|nr:MBL fold metallo-hydrolase [Alphaproteobacteria bacterium]